MIIQQQFPAHPTIVYAIANDDRKTFGGLLGGLDLGTVMYLPPRQ